MSQVTRLQILQYHGMVNLSTVADWPCLVNTYDSSSLNYLDLSDCLLASSNQSLRRTP
jgi:hypothetical protein